MLDVLLVKGRIVDPANSIDYEGAVGVSDGKIAYIGKSEPKVDAIQVVDLSGKVVMPGIIDPHVHIVGVGQGIHGQRMMARAGVTCAIDMSGTFDEIVSTVREHGAGLSIGFLPPLIPGDTIGGPDPGEREIATFIQDALAQGAVGVKILGGHYPLTPAATALVIKQAYKSGIRVAVHCGTTENGSDILGLEEALRLADGLPVHIAHVNAYCRGQILGDALEEVLRAVRALDGAPNVVSESYLSLYNGTNGLCVQGIPRSNVVKTCLKMGGFEPTEQGLAAAIVAGWGLVHYDFGGATQLLTGAKALDYWSSKGTDTGISFPVNPAQSSFALATLKQHNEFVVTALGTDGGSIPRNTTVAQGLALVKYGALSLQEFVKKASTAPAKMFGLGSKGNLGVGADADITIVDVTACAPVMSLAAGRFIMLDGQSIGSSGTVLVSKTAKTLAVPGDVCLRVV